jgi:hypothetical protein
MFQVSTIFFLIRIRESSSSSSSSSTENSKNFSSWATFSPFFQVFELELNISFFIFEIEL